MLLSGTDKRERGQDRIPGLWKLTGTAATEATRHAGREKSAGTVSHSAKRETDGLRLRQGRASTNSNGNMAAPVHTRTSWGHPRRVPRRVHAGQEKTSTDNGAQGFERKGRHFQQPKKKKTAGQERHKAGRNLLPLDFDFFTGRCARLMIGRIRQNMAFDAHTLQAKLGLFSWATDRRTPLTYLYW